MGGKQRCLVILGCKHQLDKMLQILGDLSRTRSSESKLILSCKSPQFSCVLVSDHCPRYRKFLKRLRAARKAAGLTQVEVAQLLNQPQSYVSRCESGERWVDVVDLSDFAAIYNQPLSYFVNESPLRLKPNPQEQ